MDHPAKRFPQISAVGESALLVTLDDRISQAVNDRVRSLDAFLQSHPLEGVLEWVPAYASLLIYYDPLTLKFIELRQYLVTILPDLRTVDRHASQHIDIPVSYGGEDGPDLAAVAAHCGLSQAEVVDKHAQPLYRVGMMGFTPGFAYLMGLDPLLITPRRETPRTLVPAGSVGIAGEQTGIYPLDSPGGWQLIGRTARVLFDDQREEAFLLSPGDEIRFIPVKLDVL